MVAKRGHAQIWYMHDKMTENFEKCQKIFNLFQ